VSESTTMNPKAYELIAAYAANMAAAADRLHKLANHFPQNKQSLLEEAMRIQADRAGALKSLLLEGSATEADEEARLRPPRLENRMRQKQERANHEEVVNEPRTTAGDKAGRVAKPKRAVVVIKEAAGKRIRELRVEEIDVGLDQFQVSIALDDGSSLFIALTVTAVTPHIQVGLDFAQSVDGEGVPLEYPNWLPRQWPQPRNVD
jgi:hypothetical protein